MTAVVTYRTKTPAKLNIRLKVIGRRSDGYHNLVTIMVPITLFDWLEMRALAENRIELVSEGLRVPTDEENLVIRAAKAFFSRTGIRSGLSVRLRKNIPVAAGMGGGSSDAAGTLRMLNEMWGNCLPVSVLHEMATQLGADVPFFLYCTPSLATGIGEVLHPLKGWPETWYVTITPPLQISTSWVFGRLKLELTEGEYEHTINLLKNESIKVSHLLDNDLERVTSARYPIIDSLKEQLLEAGAEAAMMTGSGPTVFGIFPSHSQAQAAMGYLSDKGLGSVFMTTNWEGPPVFEAVTNET